MIRAQDESRTKGGRIAAAWSMKRSRLETHKLTRRCPPWLTLSQDRSRFLINDCRASAAQTIFRLATLGYAPQMIVDHLNQANTSAWGKDTIWGPFAKCSYEGRGRRRHLLDIAIQGGWRHGRQIP